MDRIVWDRHSLYNSWHGFRFYALKDPHRKHNVNGTCFVGRALGDALMKTGGKTCFAPGQNERRLWQRWAILLFKGVFLASKKTITTDPYRNRYQGREEKQESVQCRPLTLPVRGPQFVWLNSISLGIISRVVNKSTSSVNANLATIEDQHSTPVAHPKNGSQSLRT